VEKIIEIVTESQQLIPFGKGEEKLRELYPSFDFLLEVKEFAEKFPKYVLSKRKGRFEIFKYSQRAFWDFQKKKFNFLRSPLMYLRGHVFDYYTYSFVTVPFYKFFNLNETPFHTFAYLSEKIVPLADKMVVMEKVNGFLVNISKTFDGKILVSTSGSLEGEHYEIAIKNLKRFIGQNWEIMLNKFLPKGTTIMLELVAPEDFFHHIVAKPEQFGFHLLAYSYDYKNKHPKDAKLVPFVKEIDEKNLGIMEGLINLGFREVNYEIKESNVKNFEEELIKAIEEKEKEGTVIYFLKNNKIIEVIKLKYKDYLVKKAKKRGFHKKIKLYEELTLEKLKENPYEDF